MNPEKRSLPQLLNLLYLMIMLAGFLSYGFVWRLQSFFSRSPPLENRVSLEAVELDAVLTTWKEKSSSPTRLLTCLYLVSQINLYIVNYQIIPYFRMLSRSPMMQRVEICRTAKAAYPGSA